MKVTTISVEELIDLMRKTVREELRLVPRKRKKPYTGMEVDALFDISAPTRHNWRKKGYIEATKIGGRTYYTAESVEKHFENTEA